MNEVHNRKYWARELLQTGIGIVLQGGVLLAAALVAVGAALYLSRHGLEQIDYQLFRGEPKELRTVSGIFDRASAMRGRGLIQLGLLVLIATPVLRVFTAALAFALEPDWLYVLISLAILAFLAASFIV